MTTSVHVSVTMFGSPPMPAELPTGWQVVPRDGGWALGSFRARLRHLRNGLQLARTGRRADAIVVCTGGIEFLVVAAMTRLRLSRAALFGFDLLTPSSRRLDPVWNWALGGVARLGVIRSSELETLPQRFPSLRGRVTFVPFPSHPVTDGAPVDEGFFYAGGYAHRDWATAFDAFARIDAPVVVAAVGTLPDPSPNVTLTGHLSPTDAAAQVARSRAVVVPFFETDLPHGPLVILDAMRLGKPVIASRTAGAIDYVSDETGILVEPSDPTALAQALTTLAGDADLAASLGRRGQERAAALSPAALITDLQELVRAAPRTAR